MQNPAYALPVDPKTTELFAQADALQAQIEALKDSDTSLWQTLVSKLRTDWTYHSNTLEGSTLTRGETHFFLTEGLTVEGKPFKDFVDAQNHAEAIDWLFEIVADALPISQGLIKDLNALLLRGVSHTPAQTAMGQKVTKKATPGQYKSQPNHVLQADGTIHWYVEPVHVTDEMEALEQWIAESTARTHAIARAAIAHYNMVRIHPFDDGNGRGARIVMNLILLKAGYFPAVIHIETKRHYLDALSQADAGDLQPFVQFIASTLITTQKTVLAALLQKKASR